MLDVIRGMGLPDGQRRRLMKAGNPGTDVVAVIYQYTP